ncbi:chemotaxis protein CheA [Brevundimonas vitis]|uniref:Chemotaxis protein CheA n=1 Tax=Brevundimonas vitisensis TaxID=2800818 RepID=A0ABX7BKK8_9CAUL|nr:chemotaxis protein CheA [Brevundimonas vitisensis]QQQ18102.1 chemotaxis protein CheA [Brevundimonas vitisensis]
MDPMEAIRATFFQECDELLGDLESGLLSLQDGTGNDETVNAVFRAVHSVKGGAGAFGLDELVRFAHVFETTLDDVRSGKLPIEPGIVAVLLRAADALADHVTMAKGGPAVDAANAAVIIADLQRFTGADPLSLDAEPDEDIAFVPQKLSLDIDEPQIADPTSPAEWTVTFKPAAALYRNANDAILLIRELERLGTARVVVDPDEVPGLEHKDVAEPALTWVVHLLAGSDVDEDQIREVFEFVQGDCDLHIAQDNGLAEVSPLSLNEDDGSELVAPHGETPEQLLDRLMREASTASDAETSSSPAPIGPIPPPVIEAPVAESEATAAGSARPEALVQTTIRVDLERVDRLIDLVGELVINQAMLAQRVVEAGLARSSTIALGLDDLEQLTREIQDSVMAIRAQPVKSVFQRMPRLVREVAAATGKKVRLITEGEGTEVDKTVIERLSEPITHMIRNAIDHGLESPAARLAAGKTEEGTVRLSAQHRSGRIIIEVADDGRGIDRERVRAIAIDRGIVSSDALLSDEEVDNLIFAPGFSTAQAISDISGRGVGMDVVKRSIQALGGRIVITSRPGEGSVFTLSLPLTLAVLDGMVVTVGDHTLVVPINVIVESLQPKAIDIRRLGPEGTVLSVRGLHVPLIDVAPSLGWRSGPDGPAGGVTLLVESELGGLAALRVDAIQGQRQVVIKSLEQNYRQVEGVAAATILGDGRVALILDVDGLIASRRRAAPRSLQQAQAQAI